MSSIELDNQLMIIIESTDILREGCHNRIVQRNIIVRMVWINCTARTMRSHLATFWTPASCSPDHWDSGKANDGPNSLPFNSGSCSCNQYNTSSSLSPMLQQSNLYFSRFQLFIVQNWMAPTLSFASNQCDLFIRNARDTQRAHTRTGKERERKREREREGERISMNKAVSVCVCTRRHSVRESLTARSTQQQANHPGHEIRSPAASQIV